MFTIGSEVYRPGAYKPERHGDGWNVWCETGALEVLNSREYERILDGQCGRICIINFANNASAHTKPGDPLWEALRLAAAKYDVAVFPLKFSEEYIPWTGAPTDIHAFDGIRIRARR